MKIKVKSDGRNFSMIDEDSGFVFPVTSLEYLHGATGLGLLKVELVVAAFPGFDLEIAGDAILKPETTP